MSTQNIFKSGATLPLPFEMLILTVIFYIYAHMTANIYYVIISCQQNPCQVTLFSDAAATNFLNRSFYFLLHLSGEEWSRERYVTMNEFC